jgi:hypothetical protein
MMFVVRPGYRIGSRTIERGSRVGNLIVSFEESSNLCILSIIFLGSYLGFIHVRFYNLCLFPWQALAHKKRISREKLIIVLVFGGFTSLYLKRGKTFDHLVLSSFVGLWYFYRWSCRSHCGDSNEPKIIENWVWMQKLLPFCIDVYFQARIFPKLGRIIRPLPPPSPLPRISAKDQSMQLSV